MKRVPTMCRIRMLRLNVCPSLPPTIGRALRSMVNASVYLVVDDAANVLFRRWIEALRDVNGDLSHLETLAWTPTVHTSHFRRAGPQMMLIMMAQKRGHPLFGRLPRDLIVECIFTKFTAVVRVPHLRYEPLSTPEDVPEDAAWLDSLFEYWHGMVERGEWSGTELADMGVSVCGSPCEDSVCCDDAGCVECGAFRRSAEEWGVYDP